MIFDNLLVTSKWMFNVKLVHDFSELFYHSISIFNVLSFLENIINIHFLDFLFFHL